MKMFGRFLTTAAAATMLFGTVLPANAEGITYTPVSGGKIQIEKYLIMDREANVPNITFDYAIEAGAAQNASPDDPEHTMVYAGNDVNAITGYSGIKINATNPVTFATADTTYTDIQKLPSTVTASIQHKTDGSTVNNDPVSKDHYPGTGEEWAATKKYARHDIEIDFTSVQFKEPGIYRYIVTEVNPNSTPVNTAPKVITTAMVSNAVYNNAHGVDYDSDTRRVLDIYINHKENTANELEVKGYVLHENVNDAIVPFAYAGGNPETKADGFVNYYVTYDLAVEKKVDGNQASHDQYFQFDVTISNGGKNTKYDITGNYDVTTKTNAINTSAHTNPTTITTDAGGNAQFTIWLQNGQNAVVLGLSRNTYYEIKEDAALLTKMGYTKAIIVNKGITRTDDGTTVSYAPKDGTNNITAAAAQQTGIGSLPADMKDYMKDVAANNGITDDTWHEYTNYKNAIIPTGVIEAIAPGLIAVAVAGIAFFIYRKNSRKSAQH